MKLSSIQQTIKLASPLLDSFSVADVTLNGVKYQQVRNLQNVRRALILLKSTGAFDQNINPLEDTIFYSINQDTTNIAPPEYSKIRKLLNELMIVVNGVNNVLNHLLPEIPSNTVYIKLPDIENLEEFRRTIDAFNKILTLTILDPKIGGEISFAGVEPGSNWYKVFVRTTTAVSLLGSLMWSAAVVYKKYQEGKILEQYAREKRLQNDHKENLVNAHKLITDITIEAEAQNLYNTYYQEGQFDNEQLERLKVSLKTLSDEIAKGAEINPALTAPEEVTNLFPDMKNLPMIESKMNKIENQ